MRVKASNFPKELQWVNSDSLSRDALKGHIILLDFWTYCCINCIHVLPDLKYLEEKYKDDPVLVIGVHSPKFENEKVIENVRAAVARYEIHHLVAMDNEHRLWQRYGIRAWPSFLLIDSEGKVIGTASGEGQRDVLDQAIQSALKEGREKGTLAKSKLNIALNSIEQSLLSFPGKIEIDKETDRLFISNSNRNQILVVQLKSDTTGEIIHTIGSGNPGLKDGSFQTARFKQPQGVAYQNGVLYVADTENHTIRSIHFDTEEVQTLSGNGKQGSERQYRGDPLSVSLNSPWDLTIDDNHLYIAMAGHHQLWELDLNANKISTLAGNGYENIIDGSFTDAQLAQPSGLAIMDSKLYFADSEVSAIRVAELKEYEVHTLVGKGLFEFGHKNGRFDKAQFQHALGIDYHDGILYVADTYNHAIRTLDLERKEVNTLIGRDKHTVCTIDEKDCGLLALFEPNDVIYHEGLLYIADTNNHLIRVFNLETRELKDLEIKKGDSHEK
ncbi:redoxin family protein [candidate division KSB1 bacterium]|nr:redoxin family protein [candidate division KSB1 bacterium]